MPYNRLSLNVGPRPLHLVDSPLTAPLSLNTTTTTTTTTTAPTTPTSPARSPRFNPHKQSSISYYTTSPVHLHDPQQSFTRTPNRGTPARTDSAGHKSTHPKLVVDPDSTPNSAHPEHPYLTASPVALQPANEAPPRPPLTIFERHAELLQFIAQKEAKCLELRSQLAAHEADLLQLKRKWERIVNRGFGSSSDSAHTHTATGLVGPSGVAVLGGIKEGMQGMSRLFAAGLSISEPEPPNTTPSLPLAPKKASDQKQTRWSTESNSSASTQSTKSTRPSLSSSASSVGELLQVNSGRTHKEKERAQQILMVRDTGATPLVSPNPEFLHQKQREEEKAEKSEGRLRDAVNLENQGDSAFVASARLWSGNSAKMHRRKSRDVGMEDEGFGLFNASVRDDDESDVNEKRKPKAGDRRNSSGLPPMSSIPGLGSLAMVGTVAAPSSWMESVGKKWGEIQNSSAFSKNQKRASIILSDVSQSIVSALSLPPPLVQSSVSSSVAPLDSEKHNKPSLLDDNDEEEESSILKCSAVLTPDSMNKNPTSTVQKGTVDEDEEWNW